jgi:hypothetical protein
MIPAPSISRVLPGDAMIRVLNFPVSCYELVLLHVILFVLMVWIVSFGCSSWGLFRIFGWSSWGMFSMGGIVVA